MKKVPRNVSVDLVSEEFGLSGTAKSLLRSVLLDERDGDRGEQRSKL